jgi:uncharacterized UPF0160 family protein
MFWNKKDILITHSGSFHSDDVFAAATLHLYYKKNKKHYKLVRTTDQNLIEQADIVFDIGGIYNEETNRFDHHQKGGAGERENGIPYAAFGLVWKKYGPPLCGSEDTAIEIDKNLVQAIDAADNGVAISNNLREDISPVFVQNLLQSFNLTHMEDTRLSDHRFDDAMHIASLYLERVIHQTKVQSEINLKIRDLYEQQEDKEILVIDDFFGRVAISRAVEDLQDLLYFVYPSKRSGGWDVCATRKEKGSFESKKPFPESWRGLRDEDLERETGISGAIFCHNSGFLCATKTKEGALELAKKAQKA